jgi:hypothetical protein
MKGTGAGDDGGGGDLADMWDRLNLVRVRRAHAYRV